MNQVNNSKFLHKLGKAALFLMILLFVLVSSILLDIFGPQTNSSVPTQQEDTVYINTQTPVREEIYYRQCLHTVATDIDANSPWSGQTFQEIQAAGWHSWRRQDGQVVLFRQENQLCPEDAVKRHIKTDQGALAIFAGPSHSQGPLLENLGVDPLALDDSLQQQLAAGGIDFADEEEMLSLLENLDEY